MSRISTRVAVVSAGAWLVLSGFASQRSLAQAPNATVALTGARLIDGTGRAPIEQATLVIAKGHLQAVGPAAAVQIPPGATRVDVSGKTIMPGLVNSHMHIAVWGGDNNFALDEKAKLPLREQFLMQLRAYADYGVTTAFSLGEDRVRGFGGDWDDPGIKALIELRDEQKAAQEQGRLDQARLYLSGVPVPINGGNRFEEAARHDVDLRAAQKVDVIKVYYAPALPEWSGWVIDEAHKKGLRTVAHVTNLPAAKALVNQGLDGIVHAIRDTRADVVDAELIAAMKRRNVGYVSTFTQTYSRFIYETTPAFLTDPFFLRGNDLFRTQAEAVKKPAFQALARKDAPAFKTSLEVGMGNIKKMADAGILLGMGTDAGGRRSDGNWSGFHDHVELELYVKAGLTPMQTLVAATQGSARVMAVDRQLGTLEPGKWADMLVLSANPLTDIRNTRQIESVWIAGHRLARRANTN